MACPICGANCKCRKRGPMGLCCSCHRHKVNGAFLEKGSTELRDWRVQHGYPENPEPKALPNRRQRDPLRLLTRARSHVMREAMRYAAELGDVWRHGASLAYCTLNHISRSEPPCDWCGMFLDGKFQWRELPNDPHARAQEIANRTGRIVTVITEKLL